MNASITRFRDLFFPAPTKNYKILLIGLDASGKTGLLNRIKHGEIVTSIVTIGFIVETAQVYLAADQTSSMRRKIDATCWDVGGCSHIRPLLGPVLVGTDALLWCVDSTDRERLSETIEELKENLGLLTELDTERHTKHPILIIATKQDLPAAMPIAKLEESFARVTEGYSVRIVQTTDTMPFRKGEALYDAFEWLVGEIERGSDAPGVQVGVNVETKAAVPPLALSTLPKSESDPRSPDNLEKTLNIWVERADADADLPSEVFLQQFADAALPSWDHYTHVRLAYLVLSIHGRQKGKNMIFDGIERYIAHSAQTRGRRAFHFTMTYFWIQMVHFGMERVRLESAFSSKDMESTSSSTTSTLGTNEDPDPARSFPHFLLTNPFLADARLWADYYSTEVLMSPEAKKAMVLPDRKALPDVVRVQH
ncbi:ADP-ribosylation factor [Mycena amicta]|nr:ADP-ribosylation factor [Mycena amicta]